MCGIAGILFKNRDRPDLGMTTGEALTEMMDAVLHRGPDSAGWALYKEPLEGTLRLRFLIREGPEGAEDVAKIQETLAQSSAEVVEEETVGCTHAAIVRYTDDVQEFSQVLDEAAWLVSVGASLDIVKDVGHPRDLAKLYKATAFDGTHGIGHTRLATESGVHLETSHPFWATGFADVSVVHNGQLTNYWIMRRRLERRGMKFHTENDTELIAVYLAYKLSQGFSLEEALKTSLEELDGTFSYLVATKDSIGYAKDKLAAKPMVKYEDDDLVAIASEEVALNRLFPGRAIKTMEPPPLTYGMWSMQ